MIKINLVAPRKVKAQGALTGINFAMIKWKWAVSFLVVYLASSYYMAQDWESKKQAVNQEMSGYDTQIKKLDKEIASNKDVKEMLKMFEDQVEKLRSRADTVQEIIKAKINPEKVLERLARDIPEDVWLNEMVINPDKTISMKGAALTYKDIGEFLVRANESRFFNKSLQLKNSSTEEVSVRSYKRRVEQFEVSGLVSTFE
jgi:Tfp pilus assembly protein PilN